MRVSCLKSAVFEMAEGVGFEPTNLTVSGFQDRWFQPLTHPSAARQRKFSNSWAGVAGGSDCPYLRFSGTTDSLEHGHAQNPRVAALARLRPADDSFPGNRPSAGLRRGTRGPREPVTFRTIRRSRWSTRRRPNRTSSSRGPRSSTSSFRPKEPTSSRVTTGTTGSKQPQVDPRVRCATIPRSRPDLGEVAEWLKAQVC